MYSEPCARLTRSMIPNTSVSPAASRNTISPNGRPFRVCSKIRVAIASLQRTLARVRVRMVFEPRAQRAVGDAPLGVALHYAQVVVLDRESIAVELEGSTHRL